MPEIELKKIQPNRLNPRLEFSKSGLDELADSIKQVGILEPIIVRPKDDGTFEVVVGERRYRAAHQAGLDIIPVSIHDYSDEEVMEVNLVENIQREDLNAVEKGRICRELLDKFPDRYPSNSALAQRLGHNVKAINSWLQLINMPTEVQQRIAPETGQRTIPRGKVDYDTVVRISRQVKEPKKFIDVIDHIAEHRVPRRIATQVTKHIVNEPEKSVAQVFHEIVDEAPLYLPFSKQHADSVLKNVKTQTSRKTKDPKLQPGSIVRAQITHFADLKITDVYRKKLGDFNEEDAQREGGYTLDQFREVWESLHGQWNPNESVYVIKYRLVNEVGGD